MPARRGSDQQGGGNRSEGTYDTANTVLLGNGFGDVGSGWVLAIDDGHMSAGYAASVLGCGRMAKTNLGRSDD